MARCLALAALVAAAPAAQAERLAVVSGAPCTSGLEPLVAAVRTAASRRLDVEVVPGEVLPPELEARPAVDTASSRQLVGDADRAFREGQLERATHLLDSVVDAALAGQLSSERWRVLRDAITHKAWVEAKGAAAAATADAEAILRVEPTYVPDQGLFPPLVQRLFEDALLALRHLPTAELAVTSTPDGLAVSVDGREMGRTPIRVTLPAGSYRVEVAVAGRAALQTVLLDAPKAISFNAAPQTCFDLGAAGSAALRELADRLGAEKLVVVERPSTAGPLRVRVVDGVSGEERAEAFADVSAGTLSPAAMEAVTELVGSGQVHAPLRDHEEVGAQPREPTLAASIEPLPSRSTPWRVPTFLAGGGAIVAGGVAIGFAVDGQSAHEALASHATPDGRAYAAGSQGAVTGLMSRSSTDGTVATASAIGAGVLLGATAVMTWLGSGPTRDGSAGTTATKPTD